MMCRLVYLAVSTIIIISTVIPSTLVPMMIVCNAVVIILTVRWRTTRKQVDATHEHFEMGTNDAYTTNAVEIANAASMTAGDGIPATQNV